mmetsp:Transcript_17366/g.35052  ORF Transcript_17366/g.35052 Transcript_17366/m.35052 type:complete len:492 (-) Transcript_17366:118-1593(-)
MANNQVTDVTKGIQELSTSSKPNSLNPMLSNATMEVKGADKHYRSNMSWEDLMLKENLIRAVKAVKRWDYPSGIQGEVLSHLAAGTKKNILAQGMFGAGKTGMFTLAMLNRVDPSLNAVQCICMTTSGPLARATFREIRQLATYMGFQDRIKLAMKGEKRPRRGEKTMPFILVGTSGTLMGWCTKAANKGRHPPFPLHKLKLLVMDEADSMLEDAGSHTKTVLAELPGTHQVMLVSATFPDEKDAGGDQKQINQIRRTIALIDSLLGKDPLKCNIVTNETLDNDKVPKVHIKCKDFKNKIEFLQDLYDMGTEVTVGKSVVFFETRARVKATAKALKEDDFEVSQLHKDLDPKEQKAVIEEFMYGESTMLLATDMIGKGFDVPEISIVVNFDLPMQVDPKTRHRYPSRKNYLHRNGRAGRFGRQGLAISLLDASKGIEEEETFKKVEEGTKLPSQELPRSDLIKLRERMKQVKPIEIPAKPADDAAATAPPK